MQNDKYIMLRALSGETNYTKYLPVRCKSLPHVCRLIDEYLVDSIHPQVLQDACEHGASSDDLEFIRKRTAPKWTNVVKAAARGGYLHVFEWMLERQDGCCPWEIDLRDVLAEAAAHGHLELMKWLYSRGIGNVDNKVFDRAATEGHLSIVQWLNKHTKLTRPSDILSGAARKGHFGVVQWLYENLCREQTASAMASAATNGHLEILQWLHQQVCCDGVCTTSIMDVAVSGGHFDVVKWLFEHCNAGCSERAAETAASNGDLPMLQWLHQHFRVKCHSNVMDHAARGGQLHVLKWLHKQGYDGCTTNAMDAAAKDGRLDIVQWLHENRNEGCTTNAMTSAAIQGHLHVVKWLHEYRSEGCNNSIMYWPVCEGHLEVVKWLVEHKPETCRDDLMEEAAWRGHLDVVVYLDENTTQRGSEWGLGAVAKEGYAKVAIALMQRHSGIFRRGMYSCFLRLLNQLSNEGDTPASPLWNELLRMLEIFHSDECSAGVITLLDLALQRGYLVMARQFFDRRSEQEKCQYVAIAADHNNIVLMRWMIENGAPLSVHTAISLASSHVIDRSDRVVVIRIALENNVRKLLLWVLDNTVFEDVTSRNAIRNALERADNVTAHWLCDYLSNDDTRSWCLPLH
ncbi:hypothetical protein DD238_003165 [Peronospora effusa]|uniref:Ankyrin repeat-containing domain n=1 Tax=Peronospora effusa TaxID=542832 RepID=A0A3M6VNQ6_9STRA|nr:hypothetical protein DD238_003165 [Peronospora effusa]